MSLPTLEMSLKLLRSPFIFYCDVPNHIEIKENYYSHLKDVIHESDDTTVDRWNCNVKTTFNLFVDCLWDDYFLDSVVWKPIDQMLEEVDLNFYPTQSKISDIWANFYKGGEFQETHDHVGKGHNLFSGIYILHQKGPNKTSFFMNNYGILDHHINTSDMDDIKEGTVIIFPSNLLHYVNPVEDERCTISFNIKCEF